MKNFVFLLAIVFLLVSCNSKNKNTENNDIKYPKTVKYYEKVDSASLVIANPIIYDVIVKNPDPNDDWTDFCLANTNIEPLLNVIFNAIYQKRLIPYYYRSDDSIIPIDSIRNIEVFLKKNPVGKIQFQENWYIDEDNLKFYKQVESLIIGYERKTVNNEIFGYKAIFKVYLDDTHNQIAK